MAKTDRPSGLLPTDAFDVQLAKLTGLPGGASTQPTTLDLQDDYGNLQTFIVRSVKSDQGDTVFVQRVTADSVLRVFLPPRVLATVDRQRDTLVTKVRRRHGKRLADERKARGEQPAFTKVREARARLQQPLFQLPPEEQRQADTLWPARPKKRTRKAAKKGRGA
jgi:hypothetical protein